MTTELGPWNQHGEMREPTFKSCSRTSMHPPINLPTKTDKTYIQGQNALKKLFNVLFSLISKEVFRKLKIHQKKELP